MGIGEYFFKVMSEILVLIIAIVGGLIGVCLLVKRIRYIRLSKIILTVGMIFYLCMVAYVTVFSRNATSEMLVELRMFRGLTNTVELMGKFFKSCYCLVSEKVWLPLERPDVNIVHMREGTLNVLLFVPFGYLFPTILYWKQNVTIRNTVFVGFLLIMSIELVQLFMRIGSFDLDDLVNNTLGVAIGARMHWKYIGLNSGEVEERIKRG